jgi:urease accessory protein UreF
MNKKYLLYVAVPVAAVALAGIVAVGSVSAANSTSVSLQGPMSSLVDAIAKRFNLNPTDVQKVVSEQKTTMQAAMEQKYADHIHHKK